MSSSTIKLIVVLVIILILFGRGCISLCGGFNDSYSDGVRQGELLKVSLKGILWKSGEGQVKLSEFGLKTGNVNMGNIWEFSCRDINLISRLRKAIGKNVKLSYKQWLIGPAQISTVYEITAVEILKAEE